jgi:hypothetical protein
MEISDAAIHFDKDPILDGYSGALLFYGQTASYDDSSQDGATNRRRVLSLAPALSMPTRRVVSLYGDRWVVGTGTPDGFLGSVIRQHFTMKRVTDLMAVLTPSEALAASAGTPAYVQRMYFKDVVNTLTDAEYDTQWNIFIAPGEAVVQGTFFRDADSRLYRVRQDYLPTEGLRVCQSDALDVGARTTATFGTGSYDPITDTTSAGTTTVNAITLDIPKFYRFLHVSDAKTLPGDIAVFVPSATTVVLGGTFTMGGATWRVMAKQTEMDATAIHARRA